MPTATSSPAVVVVDVEHFCNSVYPRLVGALSLAHGDRALAEELAQEALSRIIERWDRVQQLDDPDGYTIQTGFNLGRSWWRRRTAERRAHARAGFTGHRDAHHDHDVADVLAVRQALTALPPRQQQAILHRYYLGRSVAQTAELMGCAEGTVKALTSQAIDSLRQAGLGVTDE
jgi:RNA polymerase sigma-70 factor (ECF subfamily)